MRTESRLVGRSAEVAVATGWLGADPPRSIVLGGLAGVGKTRLARELAGPAPVWISGSASSSGIPAAAVLRFVADPAEGSAVDGTAAALARNAIAGVRRSSPSRIVVDDAHLLDDISALVVHELVLEATAPVVLTVRSGEPAPTTISRLWEDRLVERIDLVALSGPETAELSASLLDGAVESESAAALFASSQGNPLLLRELLRDAVEAGTLRPAPSGWSWTGGVGRARHLRDAIRRRLEGLEPAAREVVTCLALVEPLDVDVLGTVVPAADLGDAEDRGLVQVVAFGDRAEARLGHPLLGEVLIADADPALLLAQRRALADAIAASGDFRGEFQVAKLRLDAGDRSDPAEQVRAAARAILLGAPQFALALASAAVAAEVPPANARLLLGEALLTLRQQEEAVPHLLAALDLVVDDSERLRAVQSLQVSYQRLGRPDALAPVLARARELVLDPAWRAVVDCVEVQQHMFAGRSAEGLRQGESLLVDHADPRVHLRLVSSIGIGRILHGRTGDGLAFTTAMLPESLRFQDELPLAPAWVLNAHGIGLMMAGQLDDAVAFVEVVRSMIVGSGMASMHGETAMLDLFAGRVALARGHAERAIGYFAPAVDRIGVDDVSGLARWGRSLLAEATALTGRQAEAVRILGSVTEATSIMQLYEGDAVRAGAWVHALGGELHRSIDSLTALAARQEREGQYGLEALSLHHALRLGGGAEVIERLAVAAGRSDGAFADAYAAHSVAARSRHGRDAVEAADAFGALGVDLEAAELLSEAARRFEREGLRSRAAEAARHSEQLVAACGDVRTPGLVPLAARAQLTRREREVVTLAAQGLSNKEIADRLFVSVRTAEGHLYRASTKLGVTDRAGLAKVLETAPVPDPGTNA